MSATLAPFWVTAGGTVHAAGCQHIRRAFASVWSGSNRFPGDQACRRCLPDGLPDPPP